MQIVLIYVVGTRIAVPSLLLWRAATDLRASNKVNWKKASEIYIFRLAYK